MLSFLASVRIPAAAVCVRWTRESLSNEAVYLSVSFFCLVNYSVLSENSVGETVT